jgi:hypothetical protein
MNKRKVHVEAHHIPGETNQRADWLSRNADPKIFSIKTEVYHELCRRLNYRPQLDVFASRTNKKCKNFCSWRTDLSSKGNAFQIHWASQPNWMNPPWELIPRALQKLKADKATALACLPIWPANPCWRQMMKLMTGVALVMKNQAIFLNQEGKELFPPRWGTLFTILSGTN